MAHSPAGAVPIIPIGGLLLVPIGAPPSDAQARQLREGLLAAICRTGCRKVAVDLSTLDVIDSYMTRLLYDTLQAAEALGARGAIVGLQPAVAMTMVQMGIDTLRTRTFLNLDAALVYLEGGP